MAKTAKIAKKPERAIRWRLWLGLLACGVAGVSSAVAGLKIRECALTDPQFTLSRNQKDSFVLEGVNYTSRSKVLRIFAADFEHSIFAAPLAERRRRLLAIDWVEDASVSRVWPNRLVVRILERKPVAFVYFRSAVLLVDARGNLLEPPVQAKFDLPVLSGVSENQTEEQRRESVGCLLRVEEDLGVLAKEVSEVDVADPDNIRMVTEVDQRGLLLIMGDANFARHFRNFLNHYPEIVKRSPDARTFDLRLDDRITAEED